MNSHFKGAEIRKRALFKLWVRYKEEWVNEKLAAVKVYYSHEKQGDATYGYDKLMNLLESRKHKIKKAILYNNVTKQELKRYPDE